MSFDAFFTVILMHELMHGLGPHNLTLAGRKTTVRQELQETYSGIEEAKADVSGMWALQYLVDKGQLDNKSGGHDVPHHAGVGLSLVAVWAQRGACPRGMAIQLNYFLDQGALQGQRRRHVHRRCVEDPRRRDRR